jgi:hypothetical protein
MFSTDPAETAAEAGLRYVTGFGPCIRPPASREDLSLYRTRWPPTPPQAPSGSHPLPHPAVLEAYEDGSLFPAIQQGEIQHGEYAGLGLRPEEYAVMVIVAGYQGRLANEVRQKAA